MLPLSAIYWDPKPEIFIVPVAHWPILWYGVLFALAFAAGFPIFVKILTRYFQVSTGGSDQELKKRAVSVADRFTIYMLVGTVLGARIGHFLFYEHPAEYFDDPLQIFRVWEGGLASHGAAVGIVLACIAFSWRIRSTERSLTPIRLLDFLSIPAALGGAFIRVGNFFNQEILGKPTDVPWAVVFGHPVDRSLPIPRHPVQLYEAVFYLFVFALLWGLSRKDAFLLAKGKLIGLFLALVFGFRFFIEAFKTEQSHLLSPAASLTMGQWLSIPAVVLGLALFFWKREEK